MERCPCCSARLSGARSCPRCQANLADAISTGQQAQHLFEKTVELWLAQEPKLAVLSLTKALGYKKIPSALLFRDFIIRQYCPTVIGLLANAKYQEAQQTLGLLIALHPTHMLLLQLQEFCRYLITKQALPTCTL